MIYQEQKIETISWHVDALIYMFNWFNCLILESCDNSLQIGINCGFWIVVLIDYNEKNLDLNGK